MKTFYLSETRQKPLSTVQLPDLELPMGGCTVRVVGDELVVLGYEGRDTYRGWDHPPARI